MAATDGEAITPLQYKSILEKTEKLNEKLQAIKRSAVKPHQKAEKVKRIKIADPIKSPAKKPLRVLKGKQESKKDPSNGAIKKEDKVFEGKQSDKKFDKNSKPIKQEPGEKTNWKEFKKEKKELKVKRQSKKKTADLKPIAEQAKSLWISLTLKTISKSKQIELSNELLSALKGQLLKCAVKHDTSRFIQAAVSKGSAEAVETVFQSLKENIVALSLGKHSHWCVIQLLKHGTRAQKHFIITSFESHTSRLMKSSVGCRVLEEAYNDHATSNERSRLIQEFYSLDYRYSKDDTIKSLKDAIEKKPEKKVETLTRLNDFIKKLIAKNRWRLYLFHTLLYEYLTQAEEDDKKEMLGLVQENLLEMVHTKEGARVAMISLWESDKKVRKQILKSFKGKILDICKEAQGHRVLLALFDCIDDTIMVSKIVIQEILSNISEVMGCETGRKVVLYILAFREKRFFDQDTIQYLSTGDGNPHTKKQILDIHNELQSALVPGLTEYLEQNIEFYFLENSKVFYFQVLIGYLPSRTAIFDKIVEFITTEPWKKVSEVKQVWKLVAFFVRQAGESNNNPDESIVTILMKSLTPSVIKSVAVNFEGRALLCSLLLFAQATDENFADLVKTMTKVVKDLEGGETLRKWLSATSKDKDGIDDEVVKINKILKLSKKGR